MPHDQLAVTFVAHVTTLARFAEMQIAYQSPRLAKLLYLKVASVNMTADNEQLLYND